jgi:protein TonB
MNDGVNTTPEQAARSLRIVRLVSFGASAGLAALVLLGVAALRYTPLWPQADAPRIAMVSEVVRPPDAPQPTRSEPEPTRREAQPEEAPMPAPTSAPAAAPSEPVTVTDPVWITRPRNPERFYPREAFMQGLAGEVVLDCDVDEAGRLACVVASETPEGRGFGDAALRLANAHVMRPASRNGAPARGRYRMVVPFSPSG